MFALYKFFLAEIRTGAEKWLQEDALQRPHSERDKSHGIPHGINIVFFSAITIIYCWILFVKLPAEADIRVGQYHWLSWAWCFPCDPYNILVFSNCMKQNYTFILPLLFSYESSLTVAVILKGQISVIMNQILAFHFFIIIPWSPSSHPSSTTYLWLGHGGSRFSRGPQTSLSLAASTSSDWGISRRSQASAGK